MSRVSIIERLYGNKNKKSALEFNYDLLMAPPIRSLFSEDDIRKLYQIATSLKYNANIECKELMLIKLYTLIEKRGFRIVIDDKTIPDVPLFKINYVI